MTEDQAEKKGEVSITPLSPDDGGAVTEIFNYYIVNSDAAFLEKPVSSAFFPRLFPMTAGMPVVAARDHDGILLGFGLLRPHNPLPAFRGCVELGLFVHPDRTREGIGASMLRHLLEQAREKRVCCILAPVSSRNTGSIRFHEKNGFVECGRFRNAGIRWGRPFDLVWLQKDLSPP